LKTYNFKPRGLNDQEKGYSVKQMVAKLRKLADCLENGKQFQIQIAGERIQIPAKAIFNIEHEREGNTEEVEFQVNLKTAQVNLKTAEGTDPKLVMKLVKGAEHCCVVLQTLRSGVAVETEFHVD
jgi:amphi-Trp domain-containing protein